MPSQSRRALPGARFANRARRVQFLTYGIEIRGNDIGGVSVAKSSKNQ